MPDGMSWPLVKILTALGRPKYREQHRSGVVGRPEPSNPPRCPKAPSMPSGLRLGRWTVTYRGDVPEVRTRSPRDEAVGHPKMSRRLGRAPGSTPAVRNKKTARYRPGGRPHGIVI